MLGHRDGHGLVDRHNVRLGNLDVHRHVVRLGNRVVLRYVDDVRLGHLDDLRDRIRLRHRHRLVDVDHLRYVNDLVNVLDNRDDLGYRDWFRYGQGFQHRHVLWYRVVFGPRHVVWDCDEFGVFLDDDLDRPVVPTMPVSEA